MEDQMFSSSTEEGVKMFLRANETVHVPFKFQSFVSFSVTPEMVSQITFWFLTLNLFKLKLFFASWNKTSVDGFLKYLFVLSRKSPF